MNAKFNKTTSTRDDTCSVLTCDYRVVIESVINCYRFAFSPATSGKMDITTLGVMLAGML